MAKKKGSRPNVPQEALARARAELYGETNIAPETTRQEEAPEGTVAAARKRAPQRKIKPAVSIDDLREEYVYVISDLRSMAILAGLLFIALIAAALVFV